MTSPPPFVWIHIPGSILALVISLALLTVTGIFFLKYSLASWAMLMGFLCAYTSGVIDLLKRFEFLQHGIHSSGGGVFPSSNFVDWLTAADLFGKLLFCAGLLGAALRYQATRRRIAELEAISKVKAGA